MIQPCANWFVYFFQTNRWMQLAEHYCSTWDESFAHFIACSLYLMHNLWYCLLSRWTSSCENVPNEIYTLKRIDWFSLRRLVNNRFWWFKAFYFNWHTGFKNVSILPNIPLGWINVSVTCVIFSLICWAWISVSIDVEWSYSSAIIRSSTGEWMTIAFCGLIWTSKI